MGLVKFLYVIRCTSQVSIVCYFRYLVCSFSCHNNPSQIWLFWYRFVLQFVFIIKLVKHIKSIPYLIIQYLDCTKKDYFEFQGYFWFRENKDDCVRYVLILFAMFAFNYLFPCDIVSLLQISFNTSRSKTSRIKEYSILCCSIALVYITKNT